MAPFTTKTSSGTSFPDHRFAAKITKLHSNFRHRNRAPAKQEHNRLVATLLATAPDHISTKQQWTTYLASHSQTKALKTCAYQTSTFGAEITVSRWWDGNHSLRTAGLLAQASVSTDPSMQVLVRRCTKIHIRLKLAGLKPLNRFYEGEDVALIEETVSMALRPVEQLVRQCRRAEEVTVEVDGGDGATTTIAAEMLGDPFANEHPRITVARVRRSEIPPVCAGHLGRGVRRTDGEAPVHRGLQGIEHEVVVIEDDDDDEAEVKIEEIGEVEEVEEVEESEESEQESEEEENEEEYEEEYEEPRPGLMNTGVYYVRKGGELMIM
ncbi:hypothetical protein LTR95_012157 [Oleoguttula sp. CCFEE 5521]